MDVQIRNMNNRIERITRDRSRDGLERLDQEMAPPSDATMPPPKLSEREDQTAVNPDEESIQSTGSLSS
jgi:hypothetical protein